MSEVKRWQLKGFIPGVEGVSKAVLRPWVVMAEDFDALAKREEIAQRHLERMIKHSDALAQQLAASQAEVRRLNEAAEFTDKVSQGVEDALRAQLAEAVGLLRSLKHGLPIWEQVDDFLSGEEK